MTRLLQNEVLKILRRHRFTVIVAILAVVLSLVAYGVHREASRRSGEDWRIRNQERIARYENMIRRGRVSESWERSLRAEIARLQYHLDRGINPERVNAPTFTRNFPSAAGFLLLPLLIAVLGADLVSAERAEGTDKLLLSQPVQRWKVLASKVVALYLFTAVTLVVGALLAWLISGIVLEPRGWGAPVFSGFEFSEERGLDFSEVRMLPLWLDSVVAYGLQWYALVVVGSIALLLSVLFRSSAASMGTILAALIAGTILTRMTPDWTAGKYLFVSAVPLAAYYSGQAPPYPGMSIGFCVTILAVWGLAALVAAFLIFTRRDVLG